MYVDTACLRLSLTSTVKVRVDKASAECPVCLIA